MSRNSSKIVNFQFLINRPIWPILMIGKLYKVSIDYFDPNPAYRFKKVIFRQKIAFFVVNRPKMAFSHNWKNRYLVEISTKLEYSRKIQPPETSGFGTRFFIFSCQVTKMRFSHKSTKLEYSRKILPTKRTCNIPSYHP